MIVWHDFMSKTTTDVNSDLESAVIVSYYKTMPHAFDSPS